ncbi:MAG: DUF2203 domain-containing protein [Acidobacteriia bacterium]|nr:DUF2203 domain-containing protein [Terriglobia bacterium]
MCRLIREMDGARAGAGGPDEPVARGYFSLVGGFLAAVGRIEAAGVRIKDPRAGLLDFPALRNGRPVFLCWWIAEPSVAFWHEPEAGLVGRRPVDDEGPWEEPPSVPPRQG